MQTSMEYRGYEISQQNRRFNAIDPESGASISAQTVENLTKALDELWKSLDRGVCTRQWIRKFLNAKAGETINVPSPFSFFDGAVAVGAAFACILLLTAGAYALDIDKDGHITAVDFHHIVNLIAHGTVYTTRTVEIDGRVARVSFRPTPNPKIDYEMHLAME